MIRNPHTLDDSWWDGAERFEYVNRNIISKIQNEDLFKFTKLFSPISRGLHMGGTRKSGKRSNWFLEKEPLSILLNLNYETSPDICARAEHLPFKDETFGYIVSFHVIEHIKGDLLNTFKEWLRVLVPNGIISASLPSKKYFSHNPDNKKDGEYACNEMYPEDLLNIFEKLNVDILLFNSRENNFDFDFLVRKKCEF
jgi:SAM-dependent methyltransferase